MVGISLKLQFLLYLFHEHKSFFRFPLCVNTHTHTYFKRFLSEFLVVGFSFLKINVLVICFVGGSCWNLQNSREAPYLFLILRNLRLQFHVGPEQE
jgi:hypothetical protein